MERSNGVLDDKDSGTSITPQYVPRQPIRGIVKAMGPFTDVAYTLSSSLGVDDQNRLSTILDANGASRRPLEDATHIITNTLEFEGWESVPKSAEVVTVSLSSL